MLARVGSDVPLAEYAPPRSLRLSFVMVCYNTMLPIYMRLLTGLEVAFLLDPRCGGYGCLLIQPCRLTRKLPASDLAV